MTAPPEPFQHDDAQEISQMETLGRRIEAAVDGNGSGGARGAEIVARDGF